MFIEKARPAKIIDFIPDAILAMVLGLYQQDCRA